MSLIRLRETFVSEGQVIARSPQPTGQYRVREAGHSKHDNLFTAIYLRLFSAPNIFAAVFNHPFTGAPFGHW